MNKSAKKNTAAITPSDAEITTAIKTLKKLKAYLLATQDDDGIPDEISAKYDSLIQDKLDAAIDYDWSDEYKTWYSDGSDFQLGIRL